MVSTVPEVHTNVPINTQITFDVVLYPGVPQGSAEEVFVVKCGWIKVEDAEGSTYFKGVVLCTLYIDDIVMGGPAADCRRELLLLSKHIIL